MQTYNAETSGKADLVNGYKVDSPVLILQDLQHVQQIKLELKKINLK
jgi:hypothetical protein